CRGPPGDGLGGHLALAHRTMREHRLAGRVADGTDARICRRAARVDLDEAARVLPGARGLQTKTLRERTAADGDERAVERRPRAGEGGLDAARRLAQRLEPRVEADGPELLVDPSRHPLHEVTIGAGQ